MARPGWIVLGLALAAAGCAPGACVYGGSIPGLDYCVESWTGPLIDDSSTCEWHGFASCKNLGYTMPCETPNGSTIWKRPATSC